ncbi:protein LNK1-like [Rhododendron vialii]|uniref:protein LNK1-like n=1 Tax=Rhododendron vialii TaxID=182163 RepID=UPI00265EDDD8|nr:protein LNK1-like [Rhododendron vialii]XP_058191914.1 protein LNK1-like [Rhododendron vialii]
MCFKCWIKQIGGMSDLCMYELDDNVWDEFDQTGDHIVPHPGNDHKNEPSFLGDGCKKARREVIGDSINAGDWCTAKYITQGKGEGVCKPLKNMLGKDSWSLTPEGVFSAPCDSNLNKEAAGLDDTIGTDFCPVDTIIGERGAADDSNSYPQYPLGDISQSDNDLSFFDNEWPDIGNFEDVDRMFRSCDSTFGLGSVGNEDDLSWFSSGQTVEGSEDMLKSEAEFSCLESIPFKNLPEQHGPSKLNNASSSVNSSNMDSASISCKSSFRASKGGEPDALGHFTVMNGSSAVSESKYGFAPKEQINFQKKQAKHRKQSEGKRKDRWLENGVSSQHTGNLQFNGTKLPSDNLPHQVYTSPDIQKQKKNIRPDYFGYLQTHIPYVHLDYMHPTKQKPVSSMSNGLTSPSPKGSSYASNRVQSMGSAHDRSFESPSMTADVKKEKLQCRQGFHSSFRSKTKDVDMTVQTASCDPISVPKQVHHLHNARENHNEVERSPADLDSCNVQESSCRSSGLDDISLEASCFRQLQQVVEQLDTRTKLQIRDSLYRLARSAEQRNRNASLKGGSIDDRDASGAFMAEETNKYSRFMDMETDTNPIDRSIAHLLFHRPSVSSMVPPHDGSSLNSQTVNHGSIALPLVMSEKLVCQEETPSEADKKEADPRR